MYEHGWWLSSYHWQLYFRQRFRLGSKCHIGRATGSAPFPAPTGFTCNKERMCPFRFDDMTRPSDKLMEWSFAESACSRASGSRAFDPPHQVGRNVARGGCNASSPSQKDRQPVAMSLSPVTRKCESLRPAAVCGGAGQAFP
jgi:hypothetical protein